jgi:hypothetical protein
MAKPLKELLQDWDSPDYEDPRSPSPDDTAEKMARRLEALDAKIENAHKAGVMGGGLHLVLRRILDGEEP